MTVEKGEYRNGTVALLLNDADGELYAVATVNLCHPLQSDSMAFLDEYNLAFLWPVRTCIREKSLFLFIPLKAIIE